MIKQKNLDVDKQKLIQNVLQNFGAFIRLKNAKESQLSKALSNILKQQPVQHALVQELKRLDKEEKNEKVALEQEISEEEETKKRLARDLAAWEHEAEPSDLPRVKKLGEEKHDLEIRDQKISNHKEHLHQIEKHIEDIETKLKLSISLPELKQSVGFIDVPSLPSFLFDLLSKKLDVHEMRDLTQDAYIYQLIAQFWTDIKRGHLRIEDIPFWYTTFSKNPYFVDHHFFHDEAKNKADQLTKLLKEHQRELHLSPSFAKAFLSMYDSLRQQISAYYTVLAMFSQNVTPGNYWDTRKFLYDQPILDLPNRDEFPVIHDLRGIAQAAKRDETKTIEFIKNINWEKMFFD